jgi:hypothetical protein
MNKYQQFVEETGQVLRFVTWKEDKRLQRLNAWKNKRDEKLDKFTQKFTEETPISTLTSLGKKSKQDTVKYKFDWSGYCATSNGRYQCCKEKCTIFPICKIKKVKKE